MTERALPILLIALCLSLAGCGRGQPAPTASEEIAVPVAAQAAAVGRVRAVLHASGIVVPAQGAEFLAYAPEPARVVEVTKKEGDAVASGEMLVRLDIPSAAGDVARQRAELAQARADFESARVLQVRSRDFAERGLIPRRDLEDAERRLADAQAAVTRAEGAQAGAETSAARAIIRAPFAGVVAKRLHNPGDVVDGAVTDPILRVVDPRRLDISASVPVAQLAHVLPGASARLAGGAETAGVRLTVAARPSAADVGPGGMVVVLLTLLDPFTLPADTAVQVDIDLEERATAVLVPPEAIVRDGAMSVVFVAVGDRAERREVTTGVVDEESIEIAEGVRAGELVITRGHSGLRDGALISVGPTAR